MPEQKKPMKLITRNDGMPIKGHPPKNPALYGRNRVFENVEDAKMFHDMFPETNIYEVRCPYIEKIVYICAQQTAHARDIYASQVMGVICNKVGKRRGATVHAKLLANLDMIYEFEKSSDPELHKVAASVRKYLGNLIAKEREKEMADNPLPVPAENIDVSDLPEPTNT